MVYVLYCILQICRWWVQTDLLPSSFVLSWLKLESATCALESTDGPWADSRVTMEVVAVLGKGERRVACSFSFAMNFQSSNRWDFGSFSLVKGQTLC